jgi:phosphate/sulfate permease
MLIDHLDVILCAGRLTSENRATILAAANTPSLNLTGIDKVKYVAGLIALIRGQTPLCLSGISGVVGLATFGRHVIATVGRKITHLTPSRGFAAELAAATTIVIASGTGIPVSTTHTLVGAVLGVGMARGISAIDLNVVRRIFMSWLITIPAGAILSIVFFFMLKTIFS